MNNRQVKLPDPIITSKSSLNSSSSSISPSTSTYQTTPTSVYRNIPLSTSRNTKLEKIIQNFYNKTAQIIIQSRTGNNSNHSKRRKLNKWFNITTNDSENLKDELKFWKSFIRYQEEEYPPLVIDVYLEIKRPELLQEGDNVNGWHKLDFGLKNNIHRVLIESWTLTLNHPLPDFPVDLPNLYKRSIVFFRSLHSLVRLLPAYKLYQKSKLHNGYKIGYRLSTVHKSNRNDEISFDHPLTNIDTIQFYDFEGIVTPLGIFKLKLLYREHCQFDTKEESPLHAIDVEENFFTPTMTKYRQENTIDIRQSTPPIIYPSSSTSSTRSNRLNSYRSTMMSRSNNPNYSISSTTNALERRPSVPLVSPFKSPSLSSSPQADLMFTSRSQTSDRSRPESASFGRKTEFSSSFEKFFKNNKPTADMPSYSTTRRWSRASDHSSINMDSEEDEEGLQEFMKFIGAKQELKLFQQYTSSSQTNFMPNEIENDTTKSLSYFRNIQETHNLLSDSMIQSQQNLKMSFELNRPAIPSPLHHRKEDQMDVIKTSPLKNRQAPPPPPPKLPQHRTNHVDDDDSLVFKMSELSGAYDENLAFYFTDKQQQQQQQQRQQTRNHDILSDTTNKKKHLDTITRQFFYG